MFIFFILVIFLLLIIFLASRIHKFPFILNIKNTYLSWIISFIPIICIFLLCNYVNFLVIIVHLDLFFLLTSLLIKIIKKISKKDFNYYYIGISSILLTIIYLGIGMYLAYHVFETHYEIYTSKDLGTDSIRIIQISDAHIGTTFDGDGFYKKIEEISKIECDLFVITGDYVDDGTKKDDMIKATKAFSLLKPTYGVYYVFGNHDRGYFNYRDFNENDLIDELEKNNVLILKDEIKEINNFYLIGRDDKSNKNRQSIQELTKNLEKDKYIIDLNHQPNDYNNEINNVDLVLSGHSHGGQLFPLGYIGLLMKDNDEFYGLHKKGSTNFIVNSGISDWTVDFKTGTKSEYVIIDIKKG